MRPLPAKLAPLIAVCVLLAVPTVAGAETRSFSYTGDEQTFVVPPGVTAIDVEAIGSSGGGVGDVPGGRGALVSGPVAVQPGQTLFVEVGGQVPGCNGAGEKGSGAGGDAADGGGATDLRTVSVADAGGSFCAQSAESLNSRLLVAGGGGGAGQFGSAGGDAGQPAADTPDGVSGGGAGTQSAGGAGGNPGGNPGSLGQGGRGNFCCPNYSGGGGGGGLYGGGGGGYGSTAGSGGGGGSSLVPDGGEFEITASPAQLVIDTEFSLDVTTTGSGSVTSQPAGIDCAGSCTAPFLGGTLVGLTANPGPGQRFGSWGGACAGSAETCNVTMDRARAASATFENAAPKITGLELKPSSFAAGSDPTPLGRAGGTRIGVRLSEDARVRFRVRRDPQQGRGGPPPRRPRTFDRDLQSGRSSVSFTGTLGGRTFGPGRYVLIARARDDGGLRSKRVRARFRITP